MLIPADCLLKLQNRFSNISERLVITSITSADNYDDGIDSILEIKNWERYDGYSGMFLALDCSQASSTCWHYIH